MRSLAAGLCGVIFGVGLAIAGMTNPAKVLSFLDVTGPWDPTLACVLGAAVVTSAIGYVVVHRLAHPWLGGRFEIPTLRVIDPRLIGGAVLFGIGWGLVGLCPGPALANLLHPLGPAHLFVAAMLTGAALYRWALRIAAARPAHQS